MFFYPACSFFHALSVLGTTIIGYFVSRSCVGHLPLFSRWHSWHTWHYSARSFRSWLCSILPFLERWSRDGRVKMSIFFALYLFLYIPICIQKATTSFDIVAHKRILLVSLFHFLRFVERQFLRRVGKVQRSFIRDNRIPQLLL